MNEEIIRLIQAYALSYQDLKHTETVWREPVIGFADAADPLFPALKEIIGPNHALPSDIVQGARTVIVFFLPFAANIVKSNIEGDESSRAWDYACIETNQFIGDLSQYLYEKLTEMGFKASQLPPTYNYDTEKLVSDWSHLSVAYIAGIGKFGINNMFITEKGCCCRLGSVITDLALTPTPRPEEEHCLYRKDGSCKKCLEKCVNDAFKLEKSRVVFDRYKCNEQIYEKIIPEYPIGLGDACGKCMCGVPCSLGIPGKVKNKT